MSALATIDTSSVAAALDQLRQLRAWVQSQGADELLDADEKIRLVREWVRIQRMAEEVATEAVRVELVLLRRLALLKSEQKLRGAERQSAARYLAAMDEADFDLLVEAPRKAGATAIGIVRTLKRDEYESQRRDDLKSINAGNPSRPYRPEVDPERTRAAARNLLDSLQAAGESFAMASAVSALSSALDLDPDLEVDPLVREGLNEVIRQAIRVGGEDDLQDPRVPEFVTYGEADHGFVRVPFHLARFEQLRWMAEFRRQQAMELRAAADRLSDLVADLAAVPGAKDNSKCHDLYMKSSRFKR